MPIYLIISSCSVFSHVCYIAWKINGTIYTVLSIFIFALVLPFAFRVPDRKTFWFLNLLILLLVSDFAIRYQDAFIDTTKFSWAEIGWYSPFLDLAWLMHLAQNEKRFFIISHYLAPIY